MEDRIAKAKLQARRWVGDFDCERRWLEAEPPYSYGDEKYKVQLFILEGSPPKGFVLADFRTGAVIALDGGFDRKRVFRREP